MKAQKNRSKAAEQAMPKGTDTKRKETNEVFLKALIIGPEEPKKQPDPSPQDRGTSKARPTEDYWASYADQYIEPPIDLEFLATVEEYSTILNQCIESYEVNIEGFGYTLRPLTPLDQLSPDDKKRSEISDEKRRIDNFLKNATGRNSLVAFRRQCRHDLEATGNYYIEVVRHPFTRLPDKFVHIPSYQIRLGLLDDKYTEYTVYQQIEVSPGEYEITKSKDNKRFRRYLQMQYGGTTDPFVIWFKEYGDPRVIDCRDGKVVPDDKVKTFPEKYKASEIIHERIYSSRTPYGLPRYKGCIITLLGDREAEEVNYKTLKNNNIPSMIVAVSNGQITQETVDRIKQFTEEQIKGSQNYSRFLVLESEGIFEGTEPGQMRLDVKPLSPYQTKDQMFQEYGDKNRNKIRQSFRLPPIFLGDSDDYTRACYSEDTETLTENGWKYYYEVKPGERIATFNEETWELEYRLPSAGPFVYEHHGDMIHFKNRNADILVTPEHVMFAKIGSKWKRIRASEISSYSFNFRSSPGGVSNSETPDFKVIHEMNLKCGPNAGTRREIEVPIDLWIRFVSAFVADGSTTPAVVKGKDRHAYLVRMSSKKPRKIKLFRELFSRMKVLGFNVHEEWVGSDGMTNFNLSDKGLWNILRQDCGTNASEKSLPVEFVHYDQGRLESLLGVLKITDGSVDTRKGRTSWNYSTISKKLADQVQIIATHCGHRANITITPASGNKSQLYRVLVVPEKREHSVRKTQIELGTYDGNVYCFEVPNSLFVTRRNGKVSIQGNTADSSRRLADEQIFRPERDEVDHWYNLILYEFEMKYHTFRSNGPNISNDEDLLKLLIAAEKAGAMDPRKGREIVADILGEQAKDYWPEGLDPDVPFSLQLAEAVKNKAAMSVGSQVTAQKRLEPEPVDALLAIMDLRDRLIAELQGRAA